MSSQSSQSGPDSRVGEVVLYPDTDTKRLLQVAGAGEPENVVASPALARIYRPKAVEARVEEAIVD